MTRRRYAAVDTTTGETFLTGTNPDHLLIAARDDWGHVGPIHIIELPLSAIDEAAWAVGANLDAVEVEQPDLFGGDAA
jgi:hypothetical protein